MKLNIGCGFAKLDGFVNLDSFPDCEPDLLWDLEKTPWPVEESSVEETAAHHVLEHLGQETRVFFDILKEIYRIMRPGGLVRVTVPHHQHPSFYSDPTHVRAFTGHTFEMMDRAKNLDWAARNVNETMLALMLGIDFTVVEARQVYDERWREKLSSGAATLEQVREAARTQVGVVREIRVTLRANKPLRGG